MAGRALFEVIMLVLLVISVAGAVGRLAVRVGVVAGRVAARFMVILEAEFPELFRLAGGIKDAAEMERLAAAEREAAAAKRAAEAERIPKKLSSAKDPTEPKEPTYRGKLRGESVDLPGVETRNIVYTKRNPTDTAALRRAFDSTGREGFLEYLGTNTDRISELKQAGFSDTEVADIAEGNVPDGWQVHHKLPLDDGGDNSFDNLVLMENDPYHKAITNAQRTLTSGLQPGDSKTIDFPVPGGYVYPPTPPQ